MQYERKTSTLKSIRKRCLECVEGQAEVRNCTHFNCPLWPFRMGKNPFRPPVSEARRALLRKNAGLSAEGGGPRAKAGAGVEIETLRSWAGRALPMGSVPVPDPRDMNPEELAALGCPNRPPSRALKSMIGNAKAVTRRDWLENGWGQLQKPPYTGSLTSKSCMRATSVPP